eukprot:GFUD01024725.1.p1 GENE.GFUD01024725.1~~GFUD01024725.1.p1  ORF type:complete len:464 (+),score=177.67 GFUD01024725.1:113-1393(+)
MLSKPQKLFSVSFENPEQIEELVEGKVFCQEFLATVEGDCDAVAGWFKLHLDQAQEISTEPGGASCWEQVVFPVSSRRRKVFNNSRLEVEFFVKKHLLMQRVDITHEEGISVNSTHVRDKQVTLSSEMVRLLNCKVWREVSQWVSYYLVRDINCSTILDMTLLPPAMALQVLKLNPDSKLTLSVNTSNTRASKQVLDWVTTVSTCNSMNVSAIDCITSLTPGSLYNVVVISPVTLSGRLNTSCLLELDKVIRCLASSSTTPIMRPSSLLLPFRLELWCVVISSKELAQRSHLVSNKQVLGFTIADQINILAVSHQQEINYMGLEKQELSTPTLVTTMELAHLSLEREVLVNSLPITNSGLANGVAYWFMLDYGWNIKLSTLESEAYSQAVFVCKEVMVKEGDMLGVRCQMERGLLDFQFVVPSGVG